MKRATRIAVLTSVVVLLLCVGAVFAQWGGQGTYWNVALGSWRLNCPGASCSVTGDTVNLPGLSAKSQIIADSGGVATNTLTNTGISFPIAANEVGTLNCEIYFTNGSGGGLELSINGPGAAPTELTAYASVGTAAAANTFVNSQGTSWQPALGSTTSTVTTIQHAHLDAGVENGGTAGTLNIQYADVNTTGTTIIKRDSWCAFP